MSISHSLQCGSSPCRTTPQSIFDNTFSRDAMGKVPTKQAHKAATRSQSVIKTRLASPLHLGGRFLRLEIGPTRQGFSVHEDLLCSRSPYLKQAFQHVRKSLEGDCAICCEELISGVTYATWCKTCGNNIHQECLQQWVKSSNKCPFCRTIWKKSPFLQHATLHDLDADGFDVYIQWLYTSRIPSYKTKEEDGAADCIRLIKAHLVGEKLQDKGFQIAVRKQIVQESLDKSQGISSASVTYAYCKTRGSCLIRKFLIDLYAATGDYLMNSLLTITEREDGKDAVNLTDSARNNLWSLSDFDRNNVWWFMADADHFR
ncbi:hypothetical protein LEMA_P094340.1 [Plenodomus lingam JN3]|uniref:RING-type domain-containing protein n=1 Tax=Leptosphaeria maculans (strain JN3 / isolate v23.1.3 / race Av1-4-5-6-7-8) TaxID=985895 RepID=E5A312_LEPMJ|nr:hypothetical protein LEMA_P094340.1 [Plenodomus lingam JN3]CBX98025.1 hypothetical protein LEMA_P094340.1 [Plenodomus lingam JN3]